MDTDCQIDLDLHLRPIIPRMCRLDLFITRYSMKLLRRMLPDAHACRTAAIAARQMMSSFGRLSVSPDMAVMARTATT